MKIRDLIFRRVEPVSRSRRESLARIQLHVVEREMRQAAES